MWSVRANRLNLIAFNPYTRWPLSTKTLLLVKSVNLWQIFSIAIWCYLNHTGATTRTNNCLPCQYLLCGSNNGFRSQTIKKYLYQTLVILLSTAEFYLGGNSSLQYPYGGHNCFSLKSTKRIFIKRPCHYYWVLLKSTWELSFVWHWLISQSSYHLVSTPATHLKTTHPST